MVGWLLLAVFGIIWGAFLLPSWRRSPASTVEDFEQRMSLLAEANRASPGRWVLVPKKGHRFLGPQDRARARMRRRRRFVFITLLELTGLTLIMGLFQPLRPMLVVTVFLMAVIVVYVGVLLRFRFVEDAHRDERRGARAARFEAYEPAANGHRANGYGNGNGSPAGAYAAHRAPAHGNGNGYSGGNGHSNGNGHANGNGNGHGNGHGVIDEGYLPTARYLRDGGVQIIDEDVHVIVRRSDEVDLEALRASTAASAD
jgi:hypothetical protein